MARLEQLRGEANLRGDYFTFEWDGRDVEAYPGETILGALLAAGERTLRQSERRQAPRGMFCGIGICFDCLVVVDGVPDQRACVTSAAPGMRVQSGQSAAVTWEE